MSSGHPDPRAWAAFLALKPETKPKANDSLPFFIQQLEARGARAGQRPQRPQHEPGRTRLPSKSDFLELFHTKDRHPEAGQEDRDWGVQGVGGSSFASARVKVWPSPGLV